MVAQATAILSQIEGLLEQYLALGESTPFFQQATDMHDQIQQVLGHTGEPSADQTGYGLDANAPGSDPTAGLGPDEGPQDVLPEQPGDMTGEPPADFATARKGGTNALKMMQAADKHIAAGTPDHKIPPQLLPFIHKKKAQQAAKARH